jgi:hypothetical protein
MINITLKIYTLFVVPFIFPLLPTRWWLTLFQYQLNKELVKNLENTISQYSRSINIPQAIKIHDNIFICYKVTNLIWTHQYVAMEAISTFKALIDGRNITFMPNKEKHLNEPLGFQPSTSSDTVPIDQWAERSKSDSQSRLLQGVRLSSYFLTAMMWYASITNATEYTGETIILDSQINLTISYTPPALYVEEDGVLSINILQV